MLCPFTSNACICSVGWMRYRMNKAFANLDVLEEYLGAASAQIQVMKTQLVRSIPPISSNI